jgi:phosphate transport system protein
MSENEHEHIVKSFDQEIDNLRAMIMRMGGLAEKLLTDAVSALGTRDLDLIGRVIAADRRIDALEEEIEEKAIMMLARRQPLAVDLRDVAGAFRIASNLERIGDLAKNIARRAAAIGAERQPPELDRAIVRMADMALSQLRDVLDAYAGRDAAKAVAVRDRDGEIDLLYNSLFRELITYMMEDPRSITMATHLLFCAKNIERIGDHTTNIAENVYYAVAGERLHEERRRGGDPDLRDVPHPAAV